VWYLAYSVWAHLRLTASLGPAFRKELGFLLLFPEFFFIFFNHFAKLYRVSKFIKIDHQTLWRTAAAVGAPICLSEGK
jgi:hypothetical protein